MDFVSVIIPVKNDHAGLIRALAALSSQDYPQEHFEVLVVDNGSSPPLTLPPQKPLNTVLLQCAKPGSYAARNTALKVARGKVLAFTDGDCQPSPSWLREGVAAVMARPEVGLVAGRIDTPLPAHRHATALELFQHFHAFPQRKYATELHFGATANVFTRADVMEKAGPFDAERASGGDREWGNRVHDAGFDVVYCDEAVIVHPPRGTWSGWWKKLVRVHEGELHTTLEEGGTAHSLLPRDASHYVPPIGTTMRMLKSEAQGLRQTEKAKYAVGASVSRAMATAARLKVVVPAWRKERKGVVPMHRGKVADRHIELDKD